MGSDWAQIRLGDVCSKIGSGATPRGGSEVYLPSGPYTLIRSQNIHNDGFYPAGLAFITERHAAELENVAIVKGDVLLNITGDSVARACQVDPDVLPARVNQHVAIIRPDPARLDARFLRYALVSPEMQTMMLSWAGSGATRNALTKAMIESFQVNAPIDLLEQRAIAHILGTLDDKIELNRRMNETLETTTRTLFKSWFVDFDPVRAKVRDLIADEVLEIGDGYRAKNDEMGEPGLPFIRAADLNRGFDTQDADRLGMESVAKAGNKLSMVGDVAFTSKGTIGRSARVGEATEQFVYSPQVCFWRSLTPSRLHPVLLYCWMQTDDFTAQVAAVAGQTDMAPYVSLRDQREMEMPVFPSTQQELGCKIEPLLVRQASSLAESRGLAALRDALLPRLLSGEIRVKDAERIVGART